ncbi:MAG: hypothetical protein ABFC57_18295, partial [Veillonellales bacterium]
FQGTLGCSQPAAVCDDAHGCASVEGVPWTARLPETAFIYYHNRLVMSTYYSWQFLPLKNLSVIFSSPHSDNLYCSTTLFLVQSSQYSNIGYYAGYNHK